jgi:hypothetical protein
MRKVTIKKQQTLIDVALQYCGNADAISEIASLNDLELTQELEPGTVLMVPDILIGDSDKVKYLQSGGHEPITGILDEQYEEGLEIWALEVDFIIS